MAWTLMRYFSCSISAVMKLEILTEDLWETLIPSPLWQVPCHPSSTARYGLDQCSRYVGKFAIDLR